MSPPTAVRPTSTDPAAYRAPAGNEIEVRSFDGHEHVKWISADAAHQIVAAKLADWKGSRLRLKLGIRWGQDTANERVRSARQSVKLSPAKLLPLDADPSQGAGIFRFWPDQRSTAGK